MTDRAPPRLYVDVPLGEGSPVNLDPAQSHYLLDVLRRGAGDAVLLFNGRDGEWSATMARPAKRLVTLVPERRTRPQETPPDVWLLFAPLKRQRIDFVAEKAAELGVRVLWPVLTRRTVVDRVNVDRLRAHAVEAAEQCGLLCVPDIRKPETLERVIDGWDPSRRILYCDEGGTAPPALAALQASSPGRWAVLIGPEGGFESGERAYLAAHPAALAVSLGPRIMRADTAAVAALALWQAVQGDWERS